MPEALQQFLIVSDARHFGDHSSVEFNGIVGRIVAQLTVLEPAPQRFDRTEHRGVGRELLQAQPIRHDLLQLGNRVSQVHATPVPDDDDPAGQLLQQRLQERGRVPVIEVLVDQGAGEQAQSVPAWGQPDGGRDGDLLTPPTLLGQLRCPAPRCPGAADQRGHQQAALVDPGEGGTLPARFFLMRGQSVASQSSISSGSRWRGTRWGFWGVKPRTRSQSQRYLGLRRIPNSCRINWARRGALHSSVANPCVVGSSSSQRRMIFSCVVVSLGGRPGTERASNPSSPCTRNWANQRRMVLGSTSRNSATSSVEYPSRMRRTASRRRRSNSAGEPWVLIPERVQDRRFRGHYFSDCQWTWKRGVRGKATEPVGRLYRQGVGPGEPPTGNDPSPRRDDRGDRAIRQRI